MPKLSLSVGGIRVPEPVLVAMRDRMQAAPFTTRQLELLTIRELRACGGPVSAYQSAVTNMLSRHRARGLIRRIDPKGEGRGAVYGWTG